MIFSRQLKEIAQPDILICGCGCAGVAAAISAARLGASTMVIDRLGYAGGYMTAVGGAGLDGFVDLRSGLPIVGGVVFEFVRLAAKVKGDIAGMSFHASDDLREWQETPQRHPIGFNLERFKLYADRLMRTSGVDVLYHTQIVDVIREGTRVTGVVIANKGGLALVTPKVIVDATGDADIAAWAGADYEVNDEQQPMGLHFRVANVNLYDGLREKCAAVLQRARSEGRLGIYGGPWISLLESGEVNFNATRFPGNGLDPVDITAAEMHGRADAHTMFDLFKEHLPEFAGAHLVLTGPCVGVRETRRIRGQTTLTLNDIEQQIIPNDTVVMGAWWLDRHPKGSSGYHIHTLVRPYGISYRTLVPNTGAANVWVAGRCHSAESAALASSRVTITAMGLGQAAGTAAALSIQLGRLTTDIPVPLLQNRLLADDAIILSRAEEVLGHGDDLGDAVPLSVPR